MKNTFHYAGISSHQSLLFILRKLQYAMVPFLLICWVQAYGISQIKVQDLAEFQNAVSQALATTQETYVEILINTQSLTFPTECELNIGASYLDSLAIIGVVEGARTSITLISNESNYRVFDLYGNTTPLKKVKFRNLDLIKDGAILHVTGINITNKLAGLDIDNCSFTNVGYGIISSTNDVEPNMVTNCKIRNCDFSNLNSLAPSTLFGVSYNFQSGHPSTNINFSVEGCSSSGYIREIGSVGFNGDSNTTGFMDNLSVNIINNQFRSVYYQESTPILSISAYGSSSNGSNRHATITGNTFFNTGLTVDSFNGSVKRNVWGSDTSRSVPEYLRLKTGNNASACAVDVAYNSFWGTPQKAINLIHRGNGIMTAQITNNSFFNSGSAFCIVGTMSNHNGPAAVPLFTNNLFSNSYCTYLDASIDFNPPIQVQNSCFVNAFTPPSSYLLLPSCIYPPAGSDPIDPLIDVDDTNCTYSLIWDNNSRSPLINTGCTEINGITQTDPDGTPPDIGAVYYPHHHQKYSYRPSHSSNILWTSFPVVDDRSYTGEQHWNELGYMFINHILYPANQLVSASWSYGGDASGMKYQNGEWFRSDYPATQPKGFKLEFNQNIATIDPVIVNGFKADAATVEVELYLGINNSFENWIGYFVPYRQGAGSAFSKLLPGSTRETYLDHIYGIKAQTWGTCRINYAYNSPWIIDPNMYTLTEGDMVAITLLPHAPGEMYWKSLSTPEVPRTKEMAVNFSYTEELDYTPIFIELDPNDLPDEVGLMVAGVCKGAAVADSTLIEVNYYDSAAAKSDDEIEVMFYYGDKGTKKAPATRVYNPETMLFEDGKLKASSLGDYGYISFNRGEGSSLVPLVTELKQNYPNPFKGFTNISWVLEKDEPISVDIYNVKGQKVKSLFNGQGKKGRKVLSWDTKDNNGQSVASGIYFYRLNTPEGSKVQKMMVLK